MPDVRLVDIDPVTEPDPSGEGAYGVYAVLSHAPDIGWQLEFERQWKQVPHGVKRRMTVVGDRLRLTVGAKDHLAEVLGLARELVDKTNAALRRSEVEQQGSGRVAKTSSGVDEQDRAG